MSDPRGNGPQKRQEEENDDYDDQSMVEGSFDAGSYAEQSGSGSFETSEKTHTTDDSARLQELGATIQASMGRENVTARPESETSEQQKDKVKKISKSTRRPATAAEAQAQANNPVVGDNSRLYPRVHTTAAGEMHGVDRHCRWSIARGKKLLEIEGAFGQPGNQNLYHTRQQVVARGHQESAEAVDTPEWYKYVRHMESKNLSDAMRSYKDGKPQAHQDWIQQQRDAKPYDMYGKLRQFESADFLLEHDTNAAAGSFKYDFEYTYGDYLTPQANRTPNTSTSVKRGKGKKSKTKSKNDAEWIPRGRRGSGSTKATTRLRYPARPEADSDCSNQDYEPPSKRRRINHGPALPLAQTPNLNSREHANLAGRTVTNQDQSRSLYQGQSTASAANTSMQDWYPAGHQSSYDTSSFSFGSSGPTNSQGAQDFAVNAPFQSVHSQPAPSYPPQPQPSHAYARYPQMHAAAQANYAPYSAGNNMLPCYPGYLGHSSPFPYQSMPGTFQPVLPPPSFAQQSNTFSSYGTQGHGGARPFSDRQAVDLDPEQGITDLGMLDPAFDEPAPAERPAPNRRMRPSAKKGAKPSKPSKKKDDA